MAAEIENAKRSPNKRRRTWILVLLVLLVVVQLLCDPFSLLLVTAQQVVIRIQLAQARQRWEQAAIADYDLTVSGYTPLTCIIQEQTIRVRGGEAEPAAAGYWQGCQVPRSVPQAFDILERSLDGGGQIQAGFDRQYGYVSEFHYDCNYGRGLLSPVVSDCTGGFHIVDFTPLASP